MNNDKLEVSRELLERIAERGATSSFLSPHMVFELRALLAKPAEYGHVDGETCAGSCIHCDPEDPAAQHQGEPVYQIRTHGSCCWEDISGESLELCRAQADEYEIRTLYRHPAEQTRPGKLIYPDVSTWPEWANWIGLDATGYWVFYENKPETTEAGRLPQGGRWGRPRFAEPQRGWAEMIYERPVQLVCS